MSLSQKGAQYEGRDAIANPALSLRELAKHSLRALDDLASQIQSVRTQGVYGQSGAPAAPHPVTAISVSPSNGFANIQLTHNSAPEGASYIIEMSSTPNFQPGTTSRVDNGISLSHPPIYLKGLTMYFRSAVKFSASPLSEWTYFGNQNAPTPVTF